MKRLRKPSRTASLKLNRCDTCVVTNADFDPCQLLHADCQGRSFLMVHSCLNFQYCFALLFLILFREFGIGLTKHEVLNILPLVFCRGKRKKKTRKTTLMTPKEITLIRTALLTRPVGLQNSDVKIFGTAVPCAMDKTMRCSIKARQHVFARDRDFFHSNIELDLRVGTMNMYPKWLCIMHRFFQSWFAYAVFCGGFGQDFLSGLVLGWLFVCCPMSGWLFFSTIDFLRPQPRGCHVAFAWLCDLVRPSTTIPVWVSPPVYVTAKSVGHWMRQAIAPMIWSGAVGYLSSGPRDGKTGPLPWEA